MVGTTGVATYMDQLYVVNNNSIRIFDSTGKSKDVSFSYDRVSGITIGGNILFGIYFNDANTNDTNGIFAMDLTTQTFRKVEVLFNPVLLYYINDKPDGIFLMDDTYHYYRFDKQLKLGITNVLPKEAIPVNSSVQFMTFGMVQTDTSLFFSTNEKIIDMKMLRPISLVVPGNILSMNYYLNNLFILYVSNYNQYSILQYDPDLDQAIKTVEGGYITGPPVYSCIYRQNILISASPNNVIPLTKFNIPLLQNQNDQNSIHNPYPLFDLPSSNSNYIQDQIEFPIDQLKSLEDTLVLDTRPAQKQLIFSYLWMFLCVVVILDLIAMFFVQDPILLRIGVGILVISIVFILTQYI